MKLYEMEGFLRGKCIPGDLKVNETNAEYLVRKFSEADDRCASLSAKLSMINDLMEAAEQANKLAQEATEKLVQERNALATENAHARERHVFIRALAVSILEHSGGRMDWRGAVIVCGYNTDLYNNALTGWKRVTRTTAANGSAGSVQRTECLWINPAAQQQKAEQAHLYQESLE
ncbi:hypothetical protein BBN39_001973 [Salmonella enterica subsp. diarizonae serovar 53:z10:z]|nr:hypothetical protein [Salmonella enterica]EDU6309082.1 hypothetical protein [Salmonella enterica subsp. diarizonae serovar 53:z10:z]EGW0493021.1 hypothetical protein [Salmonella enterica]